ncbi:MAG: YncE family protein, partial [Acidobacteriota bacterium]
AFNTTVVAEVRVNGQSLPCSDDGTQPCNIRTADEIDFVVPAGLPPGAITVEVVPTTDPSAPAMPAVLRSDQTLRSIRRAYMLISETGQLETIDQTDNSLVDPDPDFTKSLVTAPQGTIRDMVFSREASSENRELYVAAGSEFLAYDEPGGAFLDLDAAPGTQGKLLQAPGTVTGIARLAVESSGQFAFVIHDDTHLGAVHVQRTDATGVLPLTSRFDSFPNITSFQGIGRDVMAERVAGTNDFFVYVSSTCTNCAAGTPFTSGPFYDPNTPTVTSCLQSGATAALFSPGQTTPGWSPGPVLAMNLPPSITGALLEPLRSLMAQQCVPGSCEIQLCPDGSLPDATGTCPGGGGGGGGSTTVPRRALLAVRHLRANFDPASPTFLDPSNPWTVICEDNFELSHDHVSGGTAPWPQAGLGLNQAGTELWVANPEGDDVLILDTGTNQFQTDGAGNRLAIAVGVDPFDIELMDVKLGTGASGERAYVLCNGDDTLHILDVAARAPGPFSPRSLTADFLGIPAPFGAETLAAADRTSVPDILWIPVAGRDVVLPYDLTDGDQPQKRGAIGAGPAPGRALLQDELP